MVGIDRAQYGGVQFLWVWRVKDKAVGVFVQAINRAFVYGVFEAAYRVHNGQGAVTQAVKLVEAAGFEN